VARGEVPLLAFLSLVPTLLLVFAFGWGVAVLLGLLNVRFRDMAHLTDVAISGLFFLTPVMYRLETLKGRRLGEIIKYNPLVPFLNLLREPILNGQVPVWTTYLGASLVVLLLVTVAGLALRYEERRLIFHL
jgi:ABC-type polysaccharide/polyol phosphate export permease